jgi:hypothetical protein
MAQARKVRREVQEETVEAPQTTQEVTRESRTVQTEQVAPTGSGVTNVNVSQPAPAVADDEAVVSTGGQVSINTPDGTQVNVNG